jgi:hypothetical protein
MATSVLQQHVHAQCVQPSSLKGRLSASTKAFKKQVPDKFKQHTFANGAKNS